MSRDAGIVSIVEGKGDQRAVPSLVCKILWQCSRFDVPLRRAIAAQGKPVLLKKFESFFLFMTTVTATHHIPTI